MLRGPLTGLSVLVYGIFIALCVLVFITIITFNNRFLTTVPARGGNLTEGVIGAPHFINPILATTDTDSRLVTLTFGNLMQEVGSYTVSPDGKIYTLTLLPNIRFSDGKPLTSDDVTFTVQKMQNVTISNVSTYWEGVAVEATDPHTVAFTLPAPDTGFLSHLSFGVLPKHVWGNVSDDNFESAKQNLYAIGAGPFKVSRVLYEKGIPTAVVLSRNGYNAGKQPLLHTLTVASYANQSELFDAVTNGDVDFSYSLTPSMAVRIPGNTGLQKQSVSTNNTVSIYRSSSDNVLGNPTTVSTITEIIDKNAIIDTVLNGYGTPAGGLSNTTARASSANAMASQATKVPGFALAVENDPAHLIAAQTIAQQLQAAGITISIKAFDQGAFQQAITTGAVSLFLAGSNDVSIPSQYAVVLPLYTESEPYIFNTNTHTTVPDTVESPMMEYSSVTDWYSHTDRLWKWFIHKDTTKEINT